MTDDDNVLLDAKVVEFDAARMRHSGLETVTAAALQWVEFPPIKFVVPGYIVEGMTILAGRPKLGKSWMALDFAIAVAHGGCALGGIECEPGDVLYCALEDNPRRLQSRIAQLLPQGAEWPDRLDLCVEMRRLDDGGLDDLQRWIDGADSPRLIVIDTFAKVRSRRNGNESSYDGDYAAAGPLQELAKNTSVAIVIVHHVRKMDAEDPLDTVSGTTGLTGAADSVLVLNRDAQGVKLFGRGRDIDELEMAMQFDKCSGQWTELGPLADVQRSEERNAILEALAGGDALTPKEIAELTDTRDGNVRRLVLKMVAAGELVKEGRGNYRLPS